MGRFCSVGQSTPAERCVRRARADAITCTGGGPPVTARATGDRPGRGHANAEFEARLNPVEVDDRSPAIRAPVSARVSVPCWQRGAGTHPRGESDGERPPQGRGQRADVSDPVWYRRGARGAAIARPVGPGACCGQCGSYGLMGGNHPAAGRTCSTWPLYSGFVSARLQRRVRLPDSRLCDARCVVRWHRERDFRDPDGAHALIHEG